MTAKITTFPTRGPYDSADYESAVICSTDHVAAIGAHLLASASAGMFVMVFDALAKPMDGALPKLLFDVQPGKTTWVRWARRGLSGLFVCLSTSDVSLAFDATNSGRFLVEYE